MLSGYGINGDILRKVWSCTSYRVDIIADVYYK